MPRTALPPTPASSTDIRGKDGTKQLSSLQMTFELPPAAMTSEASRKMGTPDSPVSLTSPKKSYPIQPSETVKARRRPSAATAAASSFALPPPPARSRKIIQMKPRALEEKNKKPAPEPVTAAGAGKGPGKKAAAAAAANAASAPKASEAVTSKKKQPSATSAAGRKIARKTAHSLIERRRRSKMNEEFAVLKGMIPACEGEMHKLAILQASIEYVRYLQDCIEKLKAQRDPQTPFEMAGMASSSERESYSPDQADQQQQNANTEDEQQPDVEMTGSDLAHSPTSTTCPPSLPSAVSNHTAMPSVPADQQDDMSPAAHCRRHESYAFSSTGVPSYEHHRHYSFHSATTSPAVGPGWGMPSYAPSNQSAAGSALTSPALGPLREERDLDQEATAALLMLNTDRRGTVSGRSGETNSSNPARGMSVRDLLSS
ncbi:hypothetical protein M406DRAFT_249292 [Cryphonectria parasitica EP155]|uniref:BHLH domain-containing protein n=1 Tax=Cryphonectria parasitica (strain ATCC 38755 / EP155) TaxID=660469 RepID=A0A9P5CTG3_CRYP1|nr:uncharacterized protein M406DRAFT_249292 [Cryphonectria parasitica EP155]KAF3769130.1 hypothetical protein M406DRAFT_249292 [Cryphonectria parasitica EP155]